MKTRFNPVINFSSLGIFIFFILVSGAGSILMGQDVNEDLLNYHFYNGYAALHHRLDFDVAPALMQTYLNPFFDIINYLLIELHNPRLTGFLLGTVSGVSAYFLYRIFLLVSGNEMRSTVYYGLLGAVIGMTGAANISLLGTTTNDNKMSLLVILALYSLLLALTTEGKKQRNFLIASGLLAGLVTGFKLIAACYSLALLFALVFASRLDARHWRVCGIFLLALVMGFVIANGYWMWVLYSKFQSPIFPFYNNVFHSSYAPRLTFNLPPSPQLKKTFAEYVFLPFYLAWHKSTLVAEFVMRDMRLALVFVLMGEFFLLRFLAVRNTLQLEINPAARALISFFCAGYLIWLVIFANYRYAIPLESLAGILLVYFARNNFTTRRGRGLFLGMLVLILLATTVYPSWGRVPFGKNYFTLAMPVLPPDAELVLLTQPLGYIVPLTAPAHRVIGMPFLELGDQRRPWFDGVMRQRVHAAQTQMLYALSFQAGDNNEKRSLKNLAAYGLIQETSRCQAISTNAGRQLKLCPLTLAHSTALADAVAAAT
jgi:hypothetical protein